MPVPKENVNTYTYADYLTWDGPERYELIEGVPRLMSPGPNRRHQKILGEIFAQIHAYLKGKTCEVYASPFDVRLSKKTVVQPDIMVVCDPEKLDDAGVKGAPDLAIEILSPSTQGHDRVTKLNLYERAGVREYWIVDPYYESIQTFLLKDGSYTTSAPFANKQDKLKIEVLEDCYIDLSEVFPD